MNKLILPALTALLTATALAAAAAPGTTKPADPSMAGHDAGTMTGDMTHDMSMDKMAAGYRDYSKAAFDAARGQQRILFFHATWCPNCRADEADIKKNLALIPKNVVIFKADFDKETALKKTYGIPVQDTFVLVDGSGKALKKWAGSGLKGGGLKAILATAFPAKM